MLVLSDLVHTKQHLAAIYKKQRAWLEAGGPSEADLLEQQRLQQHGPVERTHRTLHLLEVATYEQLQQALNMSVEEWCAQYRQHQMELMTVLSVLEGSPEQLTLIVQADAGAGAAAAGAADAANGSTAAAAVAAAACGNAGAEVQQAQHLRAAVLLGMNQSNLSIMSMLALLHGSLTLVQTATLNMVTGKTETAPASHWANVAQRLQLTEQQKSHCKLALEVCGASWHQRPRVQDGSDIVLSSQAWGEFHRSGCKGSCCFTQHMACRGSCGAGALWLCVDCVGGTGGTWWQRRLGCRAVCCCIHGLQGQHGSRGRGTSTSTSMGCSCCPAAAPMACQGRASMAAGAGARERDWGHLSL